MRIPYTRCLGMLSVAAVLISVRPSTAAQAVHELEISASKFQFEPSTIQVTAGEAWIPKGGEAVTVEFIAPAAGQYEIACSEFCGSRHGQMKAMLVSTPSTQKSR
jgi:hypothetical protein